MVATDSYKIPIVSREDVIQSCESQRWLVGSSNVPVQNNQQAEQTFGKVQTYVTVIGCAIIFVGCTFFPMHTINEYGDCPDQCYLAACLEKSRNYPCTCDRDCGPPTCETQPELSSNRFASAWGLFLRIMGGSMLLYSLMLFLMRRKLSQPEPAAANNIELRSV